MMMEDTTTEQLLGEHNDLEDGGKLGNVNLDGITLENGHQEVGNVLSLIFATFPKKSNKVPCSLIILNPPKY